MYQDLHKLTPHLPTSILGMSNSNHAGIQIDPETVHTDLDPENCRITGEFATNNF